MPFTSSARLLPAPGYPFVGQDRNVTSVWYDFLRTFTREVTDDTLLGSNNLSDVDVPATALSNIGGSPIAGNTSLTTVGTITTGTWNAGIISSTYGGTGINNVGRTFSYSTNIAFTSDGDVTLALPTSGTVATTMPYQEVTTSQSMVNDNIYTTNSGSLVTLTLPVTIPVGTRFRINNKGAGGFRIAQNASQKIQVGTSGSTTGTGGHIDSSAQYDSVSLECITANTLLMVTANRGTINVT